MRRVAGLLTLVALGVALAAPAAAQAVVEISYSDAGGLSIESPRIVPRFESPHEAMRISRNEFGYDVFPLTLGTDLDAGAGCNVFQDATPQGHFARCPIRGSTEITANLRAGNDQLIAPGSVVGAMLVNGGSGDDRLGGGPGADTLNGNDGDDTISGAGGSDTVRGGEGDDDFTGDVQSSGPSDPLAVPGTDTLLGEGGNDSFTALGPPEFGSSAPLPTPDLFDGGDGTDTATYSARASDVFLSVPVLGSGAPNDGEAGEGDDLDDVETLVGGRGNDQITLTGVTLPQPTPGGFVLHGGGGEDTITVRQLVHTTINGQGGEDTIWGGLGSDNIYARDDGAIDTIDCAFGLDTVRASSQEITANSISPNCETISLE